MNKYLQLFIEKIKENKFLVVLSILYFVFRLINLTKFPLFNDEAIYLDWGYREINTPGYLYYSLYDAKQPMLMWGFGIMQNIFNDPVFAGRFLSVITGFLTFLGIYKITKYTSTKKVAFLATFLYILVPLFSFYDRQALMESAVSAVGVWSCYFLIKSINEIKIKQFVILGIILGIGYFIKSSPIIFLLTSIILITGVGFLKKEKQEIFSGLIILILCFVGTIFLLIINPGFWGSFSSNARFSLTFSEILHFPLVIWTNNLIMNLRVGFFLVTPVIFLLAVISIINLLKSKDKKNKIIVLFFLIAFLLETLTSRGSIDRYIEPFFPLMVVFSSVLLNSLISNRKLKIIGQLLFFLVVFISLPLTLLQLFNQVGYFQSYGKVSGITYYNYLDSFTTGYGLDETFKYLEENSINSKVFVGIALNTGNPESALIVKYNKNPYIKVLYIDARLLPPETANFKCIYLGRPTYFVSREDQLAGLDKFWVKLKTVNNPYGQNKIGIYTLKTDCKNNSEVLNLSGS